MPTPLIRRILDCIRTLNYAVSLHAAEELDDDNLTILDLETIILSGQIIERQRDYKTREVKFVIRGRTIEGQSAEAIVKFNQIGTLFVITVYLV
jgi:chorismate-pyruvate lyase